MTIEEAAKELGKSTKTIRNWVKNGTLSFQETVSCNGQSRIDIPDDCIVAFKAQKCKNIFAIDAEPIDLRMILDANGKPLMGGCSKAFDCGINVLEFEKLFRKKLNKCSNDMINPLLYCTIVSTIERSMTCRLQANEAIEEAKRALAICWVYEYIEQAEIEDRKKVDKLFAWVPTIHESINKEILKDFFKTVANKLLEKVGSSERTVAPYFSKLYGYGIEKEDFEELAKLVDSSGAESAIWFENSIANVFNSAFLTHKVDGADAFVYYTLRKAINGISTHTNAYIMSDIGAPCSTESNFDTISLADVLYTAVASVEDCVENDLVQSITKGKVEAFVEGNKKLSGSSGEVFEAKQAVKCASLLTRIDIDKKLNNIAEYLIECIERNIDRSKVCKSEVKDDIANKMF